jgi:hypothetical protein
MTVPVRMHWCAPLSNHCRLKRDGPEEHTRKTLPCHAMVSTDNRSRAGPLNLETSMMTAACVVLVLQPLLLGVERRPEG